MPHYPEEIEYSEKYMDDEFEYRHVILPKRVMREMVRVMQNTPLNQASVSLDAATSSFSRRHTASELRLLNENEWRGLGVQQSRGWQHYEIHKPEPHILLFRRPLGTDPNTGEAPADPKANVPPTRGTAQAH